MDTLNLDLNKRYTYADYLTWLDDVRRELYNGFIQLMSPSPARKHQDVSTKLVRICDLYLDDKDCKVYHAPSDVRLPINEKDTEDDTIYTVVQPDLYIVCDRSKLDHKGCLGAPDFIIEIISPNNSKRDIKDKFEIYQNHGVREYWIVNPNDEIVNVFLLDKNGKFQFSGMFTNQDKVPVKIFNGELMIDLSLVFAE